MPLSLVELMYKDFAALNGPFKDMWLEGLVDGKQQYEREVKKSATKKPVKSPKEKEHDNDRGKD
jgi:hypothetical protein